MAMRLSDVIIKLTDILNEKGNRRVWIEVDDREEDGYVTEVDKIEFEEDFGVVLRGE